MNIEGFDKYLVYDVSHGNIINGDYPLKDIGTFISKDKGWIIESISDTMFCLKPYSIEAQDLFFQHYVYIEGTLDYCLRYYSKLISVNK